MIADVTGTRPRPDEAAAGLLPYRFGFLALAADRPPAAAPPAGDGAWARRTLGCLALWTHPETAVAVVPRGAVDLVLLGEAYALEGGAAALLLAGAPVATDAELAALGSRLGGRFALMAVEADRFRILHDAFGARSVFWSRREPLAVASHAHLLAAALGAAPSPEIAALIAEPGYRKRKVKYLPGDRTLYADIFALIPNTAYDSARGRPRRYWPTEPPAPTSFEDFATAAERYFDAFVGFATAGRQPLFGVTGGIDSRTLIGAFRQRGAAFAGVTWRAGYLPAGEGKAVDRLVRELGAPHLDLDPSGIVPGALARTALDNSGGYRDPPRLTEAMATAYPDPGRVFIRGYGGEIIRGFYNAGGRPLADLSAAAMARAYGTGDKSRVARIRTIFEGFRHRAGYAAVEGLGYDPSDLFYWEHRMGMWGAAMLNEMDAAMPSLVGYNSRPLYAAAFGLPEAERLGKALQQRLLERLDPALAALGALGAPAPSSTPAPPPGPLPQAAPGHSAFASGAYAEARSELLYYQYFRFLIRCLGPEARSMVDVGSGNMAYLEWFDWIPERVSIDIGVPYASPTVRGIRGDIHALSFEAPFDICTCLQVLEHVPEPAPFARRLLELGRLVLVSVPHNWPKGATKSHRHDPVDLAKLAGWFGRAPNYHLIVPEPFVGRKAERLFALFDPADPARRFSAAIRKARRPL